MTPRRASLLRFRILAPCALGVVFGLLALDLAVAAPDREARTPLARVGDRTIYVDEVEGALALRIFQHELDIHSLLVAEAERRIEKDLLAAEARRREISVEQLIENVEGAAGSVAESEIDAYLASHPPRSATEGGDDSANRRRERERVRHYLGERRRIERRVAFLEALRKKAGARVLLEAPKPPRSELDLAGARSRGPERAPVVVVHFSSLGSRQSARSAKKIDRLRAAFPDQIRQVNRHFLRSRDEAGLAAGRIAAAADSDTVFWKFHDQVIDTDGRFSLDRILDLAENAGLSEDEARSALEDPRTLSKIKRDIDAGNAAGVPREPSLFINGRFISGLSPYDDIEKIVKEELGR